MQLYRGRTDVQGTENGGCLYRRVTLGHYRGHLQGRFGLGIYPLRDDGTCAWAAVDVDRDDVDRVLLLWRLLGDAGLSAFVFTSRAKGYHVSVFVDGWARASHLRHILRAQLVEAGLPGTTEIYPRRNVAGADSVAPGGYLRLPYLAALATGQTKSAPAPGRRVALDPETSRPMALEAFLDQAEAGRVLPDLIRARAEDGGDDDDEADDDGEQPQSPAAVLPTDPAELGLKVRFSDLIRHGWSPASGYPSRSEAQQAVADALVNAGHVDATIRAVLLNPAYGISARARERAPSQAQAEIARCIAKARASSRPRRLVTDGLIAPAVHRHMLDRGLSPLAWQVLAEISATADYRTGVSLVTPDSLARRLVRSRASIYRDAIEPLRAAGVLEAVHLDQQRGRWRRVGHRVIPASREARRECEIREVSSRLDTVDRKSAPLLASRNGTASTRRDAVAPAPGDADRKSAPPRRSATAPCLPGETR